MNPFIPSLSPLSTLLKSEIKRTAGHPSAPSPHTAKKQDNYQLMQYQDPRSHELLNAVLFFFLDKKLPCRWNKMSPSLLWRVFFPAGFTVSPLTLSRGTPDRTPTCCQLTRTTRNLPLILSLLSSALSSLCHFFCSLHQATLDAVNSRSDRRNVCVSVHECAMCVCVCV